MPAELPTTLKQLADSKFDAFSILVSDFAIDPAFNVRRDTPELRAHVRQLADSMKPPGAFIRSFPLTVRIRDGKALIRDGWCRYNAVLLANAEGADIRALPVVQMPKGSTEDDDTLLMLQSGSLSGKPLDALEQAEAIKRLVANGHKENDIVASLGRSRQWLNNLLALAEAPAEVRAMVADGKVSPTEARRVLKTDGVKAGATLARAVAAAPPGKRATAKVTERARPEAPKQTLRQAVAALLEHWDHSQRLRQLVSNHSPEFMDMIEGCRKAL